MLEQVMLDDVGEGCLGTVFELVVEGLLHGTGYLVLRLFGRGRGDGVFVSLLAWLLGLAIWVGLGFLVFFLLTRG